MTEPEAALVTLLPAGDRDFAWMLGEQGAEPPRGLRLVQDGLDSPEVLAWLRGLAATLGRGVWMIAGGDEVVGLCSYKHAPDADGAVEIGYGVAEGRRGRGVATKAVALLLGEAAADPSVRTVEARTSVGNTASQRVVERNGFVGTGDGWDEEDGPLLLWRRSV